MRTDEMSYVGIALIFNPKTGAVGFEKVLDRDTIVMDWPAFLLLIENKELGQMAEEYYNADAYPLCHHSATQLIVFEDLDDYDCDEDIRRGIERKEYLTSFALGNLGYSAL